MKQLLFYILAALLFGLTSPLSAQPGSSAGPADPDLKTKSLSADETRRRAELASLVDKKERRVERLVLEYRRANPETKADIRIDIERELDQLFELKLRQREQALRDLQEEIREVQRSLEENRRNKDAIVRKKLAELLGAK